MDKYLEEGLVEILIKSLGKQHKKLISDFEDYKQEINNLNSSIEKYVRGIQENSELLNSKVAKHGELALKISDMLVDISELGFTVTEKYSLLKQTCDDITLEVNKTINTLQGVELKYSELKTTADGITATVTENYKRYVDGKELSLISKMSRLELRADSISATVYSNNQALSSMGINSAGVNLMGGLLSYKTPTGTEIFKCNKDGAYIQGTIYADSLILGKKALTEFDKSVKKALLTSPTIQDAVDAALDNILSEDTDSSSILTNLTANINSLSTQLTAVAEDFISTKSSFETTKEGLLSLSASIGVANDETETTLFGKFSKLESNFNGLYSLVAESVMSSKNVPVEINSNLSYTLSGTYNDEIEITLVEKTADRPVISNLLPVKKGDNISIVYKGESGDNPLILELQTVAFVSKNTINTKSTNVFNNIISNKWKEEGLASGNHRFFECTKGQGIGLILAPEDGYVFFNFTNNSLVDVYSDIVFSITSQYGIESAIAQSAKEINLKVSNQEGILSSLGITAEGIKMTGKELSYSYNNKDIFKITNLGKLSLTGEINATSGDIGGWKIAGTTLYSKDNDYIGISLNSKLAYINLFNNNLTDNYSIDISPELGIMFSSGSLEDATIRLKIDGSGYLANGNFSWDKDGSGKIGGWSFDNKALYVFNTDGSQFFITSEASNPGISLNDNQKNNLEINTLYGIQFGTTTNINKYAEFNINGSGFVAGGNFKWDKDGHIQIKESLSLGGDIILYNPSFLIYNSSDPNINMDSDNWDGVGTGYSGEVKIINSKLYSSNNKKLACYSGLLYETNEILS